MNAAGLSFPMLTAIAAVLVLLAGDAGARGVEDAFRGRIVVMTKRPPTRFPSAAAWARFLNANRKQHIWPDKTNKKEWRYEFMAFFARPLADVEVNVKFYDITDPAKRFVAADSFFMQRGQRVLASSMTLNKPRFDVNRKYTMIVETARTKQSLATTTFWLRGERERFSGKVTFSEEDTRAKNEED